MLTSMMLVALADPSSLSLGGDLQMLTLAKLTCNKHPCYREGARMERAERACRVHAPTGHALRPPVCQAQAGFWVFRNAETQNGGAFQPILDQTWVITTQSLVWGQQ